MSLGELRSISCPRASTPTQMSTNDCCASLNESSHARSSLGGKLLAMGLEFALFANGDQSAAKPTPPFAERAYSRRTINL